MDGTAMELHAYLGETFPLFSLDKRTRDALAGYVAHRWPQGRRKAVEKQWDLTPDEARSVCMGKASWATFDKILHHKRGGWEVLFPIFGALLDQTAEQFLVQKRKAHAEHAQRLGALVGDWWPMAADRGHDPSDTSDPLVERREFDRRRAGSR